jgi:hypothetical protein
MCEKNPVPQHLKKKQKRVSHISKYFMQTIQFLVELKDKKRSNI